MNHRELTKHIWAKFHIKPHDNVPFSPWLEDCNRNHLAELFAEMGAKEGAEIGVRQGNFSLEILSRNPTQHMYCVDTWAAYLRVSQQRQDRYFRHCQAKLAPFNVSYLKMASMEALAHVPDDSLDFVYIDGRHEYSFVYDDLTGWTKKVKSGGIVSGHDLYFFYQGGVIDAVFQFTRENNITHWYCTREKEPSFFWVKP